MAPISMESAPGQEGVLAAFGVAAGQRALVLLPRQAPLRGVLAVAHGLLRPGVGHDVGREPAAERLDVGGAALFVHGDGELAQVDGRVAAAAHGRFLQDEDFRLPFVGGGQGGPHARPSVADHQHIGLVVPAFGHPVGLLPGCALGVGGAAAERGRGHKPGSGRSGPFQKRAPRNVVGRGGSHNAPPCRCDPAVGGGGRVL